MDEMQKYTCPAGPADVVLDTDTYNELDDQFAIAYLLKYAGRLNVRAFTVAPFFNERLIRTIPEGLERSREEIVRILRLSGRPDLEGVVRIGSERFLDDERTPVESEAAREILRLSRGYSAERPLYVAAIGAITNVASAVLLEPSVTERIRVIWLGGASLGWRTNREFNLSQDIAAVRAVMRSGVPFVQIPAQGVLDVFGTTRYELEHWLKGKNALCDYLYENSVRVAEENTHCRAWSRVIWDVAAPAWLVNDKDRFMCGRIMGRRLPAYEGDRYETEALEQKMFYVHQVNRDPLMTDLFEKLTQPDG